MYSVQFSAAALFAENENDYGEKRRGGNYANCGKGGNLHPDL